MKRGFRRFERLERRDLLASLSIAQLPASAHVVNDANRIIEVISASDEASSSASYSASFAAADGNSGVFSPFAPRWETSLGSFQLDGQLEFQVLADDIDELGDDVSVQLQFVLHAVGSTGAKAEGGRTELAYQLEYSAGDASIEVFSDVAVPEPYYEAPEDDREDELANHNETIIVSTQVGDSITVDINLSGEAESWQAETDGSARGRLEASVDVFATVLQPDISVVPLADRNHFGFFAYSNKAPLPHAPEVGLYWSEDTIYQRDIDPPATPPKIGGTRAGSSDAIFTTELEGWQEQFKYVLFVVDAEDSIRESDENNNTTSVEVLAPPRVSINTVPREADRLGHGAFSLELDLENRSLVPDHFVMTLNGDVGSAAALPPEFLYHGALRGDYTEAVSGMNRFAESESVALNVQLDSANVSWDWLPPSVPALEELLDGLPEEIESALRRLPSTPTELLDGYSLDELGAAISAPSGDLSTHPSHQLTYSVDVASDAGSKGSQVTLPVTIEVDPTVQTAFNAHLAEWASGHADLDQAATLGLDSPDGALLLGSAAREFVTAQRLYRTALQDVDPEFEAVALPRQEHAVPIMGATDVVQSLVMAKATSSSLQEAFSLSMAKANGARLNGDSASLERQQWAASQYASESAIHEVTAGALQSILASSLDPEARTTPHDLTKLATERFSAPVLTALSEAGLAEPDVLPLTEHLVAGNHKQLAPAPATSVASSIHMSLAATDLLKDVVRLRTEDLGEAVETVSFETEEQFRLRGRAIRQELEASRLSVGLLSRIEALIGDTRRTVDETNDAANLMPYLEDAYRMLIALQSIDATPTGIHQAIEEFVADGDLAMQDARPFMQLTSTLADKLSGAKFKEAAGAAEILEFEIRAEWGKSLPFHVASALDSRVSYFKDLFQFGELQDPPKPTHDVVDVVLPTGTSRGSLDVDALLGADDVELIAVGQGQLGSVVVRNNGTPNDTSDDRIQYFASSDFRGRDSFEYASEVDGQVLIASVEVRETISFGEAFDVKSAEGRTLSITVEAGTPIYLDNLKQEQLSSSPALWSPSGNAVWEFAPERPIRLYETGTYLLEFHPASDADESEVDQIRLINLDQQPTISIGEPQSGLSGAETVFFQFDGQEGEVLVFSSTSPSDDPTWQLLGPPLDVTEFGSVPVEQSFEASLAQRGTHFIMIENSGGPESPFEFELGGVTTSVAPVEFSEPVSGELEAGERQVYAFEALENDRIFFDSLDDLDQDNVSWQLRTQNGAVFEQRGRPLGEQPSNQDFVDLINIPSTGIYQLHLSGQGDFAFRLLNVNEQPRLRSGSRRQLTLNGEDASLGYETQLYRLNAVSDEQLVLHSEKAVAGTELVSTWFVLPRDRNALPFAIDQSFTHELAANDSPVLVVASDTVEPVELTFGTFAESPMPQFALAVDEVVEGRLAVPRETHSYSLNATAGQFLYFDAQGTNVSPAAALIVEVVSPSGQRVMMTTTDDDEPFVISEDGRHDIRLYVQDENQSGDYSFVIRDLIADASIITLRSGARGEVLPQSGPAAIRLRANAGNRFVFQPVGEAPSDEIVWTLFGTDGRLSKRQPMTDPIAVTVPTAGDYFLLLENIGDASQHYELRMRFGLQTNAPLAIGESVSSELTLAGERHVYSFNAEAGRLLALDSFDADDEHLIMALYAPSGEAVVDRFSASEDLAPVVLPESGQYRVEVSGLEHAIGDYSFELVDLANAPPVRVGETVSGTARVTQHSGTDVEFFRLDLEPHDKVVIDSLTDAASGQWRAYDESGQELTAAGLGQDLIVAADADPGAYILALSAGELDAPVDDSVTDQPFEFTIRPSAGDAVPLEFNVDASGSFDEFGARNVYTFTAAAGQRVWFDWLRELIYHVRLVGPAGEQVVSELADRDIGPLTLPEAGEYSLLLDPEPQTFMSPTEYRFRLVDIDALRRVDSSTRLTGTTNFFDAELFVFDVQEDQSLVVENVLDGGVTWQAFAPDGTMLANRFESSRLEIDQPGEYLLAIAPSQGITQDFDVRVSLAESVFGDVNDDGHVGYSDIDVLAAAIREDSQDALFDLDQSGVVDEADRRFLIEQLLSSRGGDADLDGRVEFHDFLTLAMNVGQSGGWSDGDFNGDGLVSVADLFPLIANFGKGDDAGL